MDEKRYGMELLLRLDSRPCNELCGEVDFIMSEKSFQFSSLLALVDLVEDEAQRFYPHLKQRFRQWGRVQSPMACGSEALTTPMSRSDRQTLHVTLQFAENHTWQGRVVWLEGRKSLYFRSLMELLSLLREAIALSARTASSLVGL